VCGVVVGRRDECGIDMGKYCKPGDICAPENTNDPTSTHRCFEDCSATGTCKQGTCVVQQFTLAYCM
jgi:hypothetical protein